MDDSDDESILLDMDTDVGSNLDMDTDDESIILDFLDSADLDGFLPDLGIDGLQKSSPFFVSLHPKSDWSLSTRFAVDMPVMKQTVEQKGGGIKVTNIGRIYTWPGTTGPGTNGGYFVDPRLYDFFAVESFGELHLMSSYDLLDRFAERITGVVDSEFVADACTVHMPSNNHPFDIVAEKCVADPVSTPNSMFIPIVGMVRDHVLPNRKWGDMIGCRESWLSLRSNAEFNKTMGVVGMALCVVGGVKRGDALEARGLKYKWTPASKV